MGVPYDATWGYAEVLACAVTEGHGWVYGPEIAGVY